MSEEEFIPVSASAVEPEKEIENEISTKTKGDIAEQYVKYIFTKLGIPWAAPPGDRERFDLVLLLEDGSYKRVQVKTAHLSKDRKVLKFRAHSTNWNTKTRKHYRGQADLFAIYSPDLEKVYLLLVKDVGLSQASLRLELPQNNQNTKIRWANDFEVSIENLEKINDTIKKIIFDVNDEVTSPVRKKSVKLVPIKCPICNVEFMPGASKQKFCSVKCAKVSTSRGKFKINKEELQSLVFEKSLVEIGGSLGVCGNTIKGWCVDLNITTPPRGFWAKKENSKLKE